MENKDIIDSLCRKRFHSSAKNIKFLGAGSFGKVYKANLESNKTVVFKIYKADGIAEKESISLKILATNGVIKIPEVYFVCSQDGKDVLCMEFVRGNNALFNLGLHLAGKETRDNFADRVVDGVIAVHSVCNDKFGFADNPVYDSWNDFYKPYATEIYLRAVEENSQGNFDKFILDEMKRAMKHYDFIFSENVETACLVHGDLNLMNIMVDKNYMPTAFIDPLNSFFGDREYELFQLENFSGKYFKLSEKYKERCKVSKKIDSKSAFYSLWNEALVYLNTGGYTGFIMKKAVRNMKKQNEKISNAIRKGRME